MAAAIRLPHRTLSETPHLRANRSRCRRPAGTAIIVCTLGSSRGTWRIDRLRKAKAPRGRVDPVGVGLSDGLIRLRYPASRGGLAHRSRAGGL